MPTGVELQIQKQMDNMACWRKNSLAAITGRTLLWTMVDAANDIPYENRVKGAEITTIDGVMDNLTTGSLLARWFQLHASYFSTDVPALASFETAMATWKWRAHEHWARLYYEANGTKLTPSLIFPRDDITLGSYIRTTGVFTAGPDDMDLTYTSGGKLAAKATTTIGAANWDVTATLKRIDGTTVALAIQFLAAATLGTQKVFGEQALSGNAAAGQKVCLMAGTNQFKVGEPVLIEDTNNQEYAIVEAINPGVSITVSVNLLHPYNTVDSAKATPLFTDVTLVTHTNGTNGDTCSIVPKGDRLVSLV